MWNPPVLGSTCADVLTDPAPLDCAAQIRLCNFGTGLSTVLDSHRPHLRVYLGVAVTEQDSWIDIVGYASDLGYGSGDTTGGNWALSIHRADAVQQELGRLLTEEYPNRRFNIHVKMGVGDTQAGLYSSPDHNHGFDRAVVVRFFSPGKKYEPEVVRRGYTTVGAKKFVFEPIECSGAGFSVAQADWMYFGIHDLDNSRRRYFAHIGGSGALDAPFLPTISFSAQPGGATVPFTSDWGIPELEGFEGQSTLFQDAGATFGEHNFLGNARLSWKPKALLDRGITNVTLVIPFNFSRGLGISLSSLGKGWIRIMPPSFRPTIYSR